MDKLPTVTVQKDGKSAIVNEVDLAQWRENGWDVPPPPAPPAETAVEATEQSPPPAENRPRKGKK